MRGDEGGGRVRRALIASRPYLVVLLISSVVVSRWFRTGTFVSTGDMGPFIRQGWAPEVAWSWNHQITGAGSAGYTVARAVEFLLIEVAQAFGGDETTAQWMFYTLIYGLVGFGTAYAAGALVRNEAAIVVAGTFGVLNGFFLTRLPNPLNIISVGTIALVTGIALRVARGTRVPAPIGGFALIPTSFLAFNPPMLVVAYGWAGAGTVVLAGLVYGRRGVRRLVMWLLRAAPWVVALNAWWLVPLAQSYTGGGGATANAEFTDPTAWSWATINNTIPNILTMVANWAWFRPQYLPFADDLDRPAWIWVRYVLPAVVVLAPVLAVRARRRAALVLLGLSGVGVFLAKGLTPPLSGVNLLLYQYVPGFWLFREPMSKLGQLLVIAFAILLALAVEGALLQARRLPRPSATTVRVVAAGAALLVVVYPYPLFTGAVIPDVRPTQPSAHVRVPEEWWDVAEVINADERPGKVLVLPLADYYQMPTTWGFFGVDSIANLLLQRPVVQRKPDGYFADVPGFTALVEGVETALVTGDLEPVPRLLDAMGVSHLIVRHDLVRGLPGRSFADGEVLSASMSRVPGLTQVRDGTLEIWHVGDGTSPTVRAYDRVLAAPDLPRASAATVGSIGTGTAVVAADPGTDDVVHWSVPAVDRGPATTSVPLDGGTYRVAQRARSAPTFVPRVDADESTLVLEDPTRLVVGDTTVQRPALTVDLPRTDVVAVRAGSRIVSVDTPSTAALPVGAATPLTVYAASREAASVTGPSEVYDCNNYEPRPADQLRLRREVRDSPEGTIVRLSADDHAACSRYEVVDARPGRTYRISLDYRQLRGKRPQICVWQAGTDGCELAPRATLGAEWSPYERYVTVDEVATSLQLVLHADVGERLLGRTVTEYRNVTIEAVDPVLRTTVFPPQMPSVQVDLEAGTHQLRLEGGPAGSVLSAFEPLQDCFNYDDQSPDEAGLVGEVTGDPDDPTYVLGARAHMACLGATAPSFGASSLYELSYEARSVALRNPKVCLYLRGPDRCASLPAGGPWDDWTEYSAMVTPDPTAVETRLYLYGLRDLDGQSSSRVEYRTVRLRPVASPVDVLLIRVPDEGVSTLLADRADQPDWSRENPTRFTVSDAEDSTVLALAETYAPGWSAAGEHLVVQGWMNAWAETDPRDQQTLVYGPARMARASLLALPPALLAAAAALAWHRSWHRRPRASRSQP